MLEKVFAAAYRWGDFVIVPAARQILRKGEAVEVEAKVFDLVVLLLEHHERALGKQEIVTALWGKRPVTDAALSQLVYKARRVLDDDGRAVIRTVYGRGLQWVAPIEALDEFVPPAAGLPAAPPEASAPTAGPPPMPLPEARAASSRRWRGSRVQRLAALGVLGALALLLVVTWMGARDGASQSSPRLAVLPFANATGEPGQDWVERGLPSLVGGLLQQAGDLDVVDPFEVARAWEFTPTGGRDQAGQLRFATGAEVLVSGRLRKLSSLFELELAIDRGSASGVTFTLHGADPGALAAAAIPRLRKELGLVQASDHFLATSSPDNAYLAQTFARGLDAAARGRWTEARPYFEVVATSDPGFLPGRYRQGQAALRGEQPREAAGILRAVATAARESQPQLAVLALRELATAEHAASRYRSAVDLLTECHHLAAASEDAALETLALLGLARSRAALGEATQARADLARARTLIARHGLDHLERELLAARISIATVADDMAGVEAAAREAVVQNEAVGDERGTHVALFNVAWAMINQQRRGESLPILVRVWRWAAEHHDHAVRMRSGSQLAGALRNSGVVDAAERVYRDLLESVHGHDDRAGELLILRGLAGVAWFREEEEEALRRTREAGALVEPHEDPAQRVSLWLDEAMSTLLLEPHALAGIEAQASALVGSGTEHSRLYGLLDLIHALAAAAEGRAADARVALERVRAAPANEGLESDMRQVALRIATVTGDRAAGEIGLHRFQPSGAVDVDLLDQARRWALRIGDHALAEDCAARLQALRDETLLALGPAFSDLVPAHGPPA
ncbi:MAG: winged helix-turn-helix domain-containing protein [Xanthomonadales bacterium]|nr:winged helix-turn-helix domain-containing protein [Xanthomonadales bacterium]